MINMGSCCCPLCLMYYVRHSVFEMSRLPHKRFVAQVIARSVALHCLIVAMRADVLRFVRVGKLRLRCLNFHY